jgi:hypothetical protein
VILKRGSRSSTERKGKGIRGGEKEGLSVVYLTIEF